MKSRREFLKNTVISAAGLTMMSSASAFGKIIGANDNINIAIIGTGGRAHGLAQAAGIVKQMTVSHICDVDQKRVQKFQGFCKDKLGYEPEMVQDFRKILDNKDVDAIAIATPEHWHAPMAIMGMQAGKHVYVEKPCSHNPYENELLVQVQAKYGKVCQMGNQQRSSFTSAMAKKDIMDGVIGEVYAGKAFYANTRKSIGKGKKVSVPSTLDWELWQGPAPREDYRDNVHPYNWHWFRTWGTGEIHNNGTHEIDICRWMLGVDYPTRVVSTGGRLHYKNDDWQWFDTQIASFEFDNGKMITWEGRSCNGYRPSGGRGTTIHGTEGTIKLDRAKYELLDLKGKKIKTEWENKNAKAANDTADLTGFDTLSVNHMNNFAMAIIKNESLKAPIADAAISTQLCHLGNIAQDLKVSLDVDPKTGKVIGNKDAKKMWKRDYEKGWEPTL
ncbi:Gfo/Idh/MocA family protein [Reichenbachiella versicolor]|uniref:Gfo/Idh/MocA family protein n=1 Tax=Reichenbachiella versicolor TaxID=1821036 RepID=UPI000D6E3B70|nr:Gfo/Idh/MocA family oxidoreductase [Reichenbachiella versicolor]